MPTAEEDTNPFVSQGSNRGMVVLFVGALPVVKFSSPIAGADRAGSPFVESLPDELRASPAPVNPQRVATAFGNRGNAETALHVEGRVETISERSDGGNQPGLQC